VLCDVCGCPHSPIHVGDPAAIGIHDLNTPDYGDAVSVKHGEMSVFWACGVTPQRALLAARLPLAITHSPGHMFVGDVLNTALAGDCVWKPRDCEK
jgi:uncharacterized protein YcsI (UPF0317 family)